MQHSAIHNADDSSLRFVFNDAVFSCSLCDQPTFGDVAAKLLGLCGNSDHHPLSIAVTLAKPQSLNHVRN